MAKEMTKQEQVRLEMRHTLDDLRGLMQEQAHLIFRQVALPISTVYRAHEIIKRLYALQQEL